MGRAGEAVERGLLGLAGRLRWPPRADWPVRASVGLLQMMAFTALGLIAMRHTDAGRAARDITADIQGVTAELEGRGEDIDTIFANVTEMSERLNAASVRVDGVLEKLDGFLGEGGEGGQNAFILIGFALLMAAIIAGGWVSDHPTLSETFTLEPITLAGVIFLLASYPTSILIRRLEKSLAY